MPALTLRFSFSGGSLKRPVNEGITFEEQKEAESDPFDDYQIPLEKKTEVPKVSKKFSSSRGNEIPDDPYFEETNKEKPKTKRYRLEIVFS